MSSGPLPASASSALAARANVRSVTGQWELKNANRIVRAEAVASASRIATTLPTLFDIFASPVVRSPVCNQ